MSCRFLIGTSRLHAGGAPALPLQVGHSKECTDRFSSGLVCVSVRERIPARLQSRTACSSLTGEERQIAVSALLPFRFFGIWLICCCWSAWPCCRCCRCCRRRWFCPSVCKLFFILLLGHLAYAFELSVDCVHILCMVLVLCQ